jgi:fatty-acyl-CoA synthase
MSIAPLLPVRHDPIAWWARHDPERIALVDRARDRRCSYAELDARASRWAAALAAMQIGPGARVATLAANCAELVELFFAVSRVGAALVPLNWRLAPAELSAIISNARPALLLGETRFRAAGEEALRLASVASGTLPPWRDFEHDVPAMLAGATAGYPAVAHDIAAPWLVLYTSGSTGTPKGAVITHRQIFYNAIATSTAWDLGAADVAPISTPQFHTGGWNVFATPLWERGGRVVLFDQFDPSAFLATLAEEQCTVAMTVPTQLLMLADLPEWGRELPSLRWIVSGGAPCPPGLAARVRAAGYAFREGYGLTECGPNCFAISSAEAARRPGSVGWPAPFLEMRLTDESGRDVALGEPGELLLRGPQMFEGYLDDPERTAEAMAPGGWLRTGDLAVQDEDGAYRICGRRKEMFISGGENVFPGEVEAVLIEHPGIASVAVIGVPDERWGEVGRAFVVPRDAASCTEGELATFARARLAKYKVPKRFVLVDMLPTLGSGKTDRRALAQSASTSSGGAEIATARSGS